MIVTKKYEPANLMKECPLGTLSQKQCNTCRLAIQRYTDGQLENMRQTGQLDDLNSSYSCTFTAILYELRSKNKKR